MAQYPKIPGIKLVEAYGSWIEPLKYVFGSVSCEPQGDALSQMIAEKYSKPITNMITITNTGKEKRTVSIDAGLIIERRFTIDAGCELSISESKPEPTTEPKITCWEDAFRKLRPEFYLTNMALISQIRMRSDDDPRDDNRIQLHTEKDCKEALKFIQRRLIAAACGAREFVEGEQNFEVAHKNMERKYMIDWIADFSTPGTNYFPTKEAAEEYLQACINSGLL
jgi:hypothetical protein